jgi:hypothetical protein
MKRAIIIFACISFLGIISVASSQGEDYINKSMPPDNLILTNFNALSPSFIGKQIIGKVEATKDIFHVFILMSPKGDGGKIQAERFQLIRLDTNRWVIQSGTLLRVMGK